MRYLIIHSRYSKVGGEESVVAQQVELLRSTGHDVLIYQRSYDEIYNWKFKKVTSFFSAIYNKKSVSNIKKIVADFKPDVAIVHNLFPVISPAVLPILKKNGIRVLMSVHNYRLVCPTGLFFTKGKLCEKCGSGVREFNCLINNCQGSIFGSFAFAVRSYWARVAKKYSNNVDKFLVLSKFQGDKLIKYCDIKADKIAVVPNFVQTQKCDKTLEKTLDEGYVGFVGRLSVEKGVDFLFQMASSLPLIKFKVAGEVALNFNVKQIPNNIELVGFLNKDQLNHFYCSANLIISTSLCYEGLSLSVIEAMSYATPVMVPNIGAFPEIVDYGGCGILYQIGSLTDALDKLSNVLKDSDLLYEMGQKAQKKAAIVYGADSYLKSLESNSYPK